MTQSYREPAERPKGLERPPSEFVYLANGTERRHAALRSLAGYLWLSAFVCGALIAALPYGGGVISLGVLAFVVWRWRHTRQPERIVVTIRDGAVEITGPKSSNSLSLSALRDVQLQTRTIAKAYADKMVGTAVVSMGVMPSVDVSRIVLIHEDDEGDLHELVLGDGYEASSQTTEWLGKLRVHLRKHGWVPADET